MPISGVHLGSALPSVGTWSRKSLSLCTPKQWSLASPAGPAFFPDPFLTSCGTLAPFRLSSGSQRWSSPWGLTSEAQAQASAPSPHPPWWVSRQVSQAGECWSAPILCEGISLLFSLHPCCCALVCDSKAPHPPSPPVRGLPSVWKVFLLHSSFPDMQDSSLFLCLSFFFQAEDGIRDSSVTGVQTCALPI